MQSTSPDPSTTLSTPPVAERRPTASEVHGEQRVDDYEWLREKESPEVRAYLEAENTYTEARTAHLADLRAQIFDEIRSRTRETDLSVPTRIRGHWYYSRSFEGREYGASCRVPVRGPDDWTPPQPAEDCSPDQPALPGEELLLDLNVLAEGHEFFSLGGSTISPDGNLLAYSTDVVGDERYTLRVKDLTTGELLPDEIVGVLGGGTWDRHGRTLYYTTVDESWRADKIWCHRLGTDQASDTLVFHEPDGRFYVGVGRSRSDRFLMIASGSKTTSEYRFLDAESPMAGFLVFAPRIEGLEYSLDHAVIGGEDRFLVLHNGAGADFELGVAPIAPTSPEQWETLIAHDETVRLEDVDAFAGHLVVQQRCEGLTQLRILELGDGPATDLHSAVTDDYLVEFDQAIYTVGAGANPSFEQPVVRLGYTSMAVPSSVYDYDVRARELTLLRRSPVLGGYDPDDYEEHRLWAPSVDGELVPISIVCRRGARGPDGTGPIPVLLYGYGAYEMSMDPYFSVARLSLLDRGVGFAIAHVRGGGEMGRRWYDEGKLFHKQNTFSDFIACARHLVETGWTTPDSPRRRGRQRRRAAGRRSRQPGAPAVRRDRGGRAVRGRPHQHVGLVAPAHRHRVRGVGQPGGRPVGLRLPAGLLAVRQRDPRRLPADPGGDVAERHPGALRRAGQVDRPAARHGDRSPGLPAAHRDGSRSRRGLGEVPVVARPCLHARVGAGPDGTRGHGPRGSARRSAR